MMIPFLCLHRCLGLLVYRLFLVIALQIIDLRTPGHLPEGQRATDLETRHPVGDVLAVGLWIVAHLS
ncbi:hypothetical protein OZX72_06380 [Bifidobacterium sp. ESL0769]|uniref:hypothetical protein n=1 Tax=Bifidobacterium sp. ESL0769 TaxID=2983229 RepID=UPI0023F86346|nr:hypothetical protein [Bifidobacterium sp. ESL0769]WEV66882.1 hypothetical protein OZX72_06380 [Bifidobacterium sp. ESL0769]